MQERLNTFIRSHNSLPSETEFASFIPPSGGDSKMVIRDTQLPGIVAGLNILDVGGGTSDATAELVAQGANAFALDPKYARLVELKNVVKKVNKYYKEKIHAHSDTELDTALKNFSSSIALHKQRYKTGYATSIPFSNEFFDIVFSRFTILGYLDIQPTLLDAAIHECLRVTKPRGTVRLFPFLYPQMDWGPRMNEARMKHNKELFASLSQHPAVERVHAAPIPRNGPKATALIIQKR